MSDDDPPDAELVTEYDDRSHERERDPYPWAETPEQKMRCFVFETYRNGGAVTDADKVRREMDADARWLLAGELPTEASPPSKLSRVK
jgi:hypothetical protein